jgi:carboxymethylenebutenolidase
MDTAIGRRGLLMGLVASAFANGTAAQDATAETAALPVGLIRVAAVGKEPRPAVLILPGSGGIERNRAIYERDAKAMNGIGMDAYLLSYYTDADRAALAPGVRSAAERTAYRSGRALAWADHVSEIVSTIAARRDCSGRIGVLGISLGGFVAAAAAARDRRIAALAVLYGGMPRALQATVTHLPPLLALHGDADKLVSISEDRALVKLATRIGGEADLVVYPGKGHGFDFKPNDPDAADAVRRVTQFFAAKLG